MTTHVPGYDYRSGGAAELSIEVPDAESRADPRPGPGSRLPEQIPVTPPAGRPEPPLPPPGPDGPPLVETSSGS